MKPILFNHSPWSWCFATHSNRRKLFPIFIILLGAFLLLAAQGVFPDPVPGRHYLARQERRRALEQSGQLGREAGPWSDGHRTVYHRLCRFPAGPGI